jgi:hypothetical protein
MPTVDRGGGVTDPYKLGQVIYIADMPQYGKTYQSLQTDSERAAYHRGYNQELLDCVAAVTGSVASKVTEIKRKGDPHGRR